MAIFEKETSSSEAKPFIALLDADGNLVAFVQPASKVDPLALVEELKKTKTRVGNPLNVELREPRAIITDLTL